MRLLSNRAEVGVYCPYRKAKPICYCFVCKARIKQCEHSALGCRQFVPLGKGGTTLLDATLACWRQTQDIGKRLNVVGPSAIEGPTVQELAAGYFPIIQVVANDNHVTIEVRFSNARYDVEVRSR